MNNKHKVSEQGEGKMKKIQYKDGAIVAFTNASDRCEYDAANYKAMVQYDGCGNISKYSVIDKWNMLAPGSWYTGISINGVPVNPQQPKEVTMIGRNQDIKISMHNCTIKTVSFLDEKSNAVFLEYSFQNTSSDKIEVTLNFGFEVDVNGYILDRVKENKGVKGLINRLESKDNNIKFDITDEYYFDMAFSSDIDMVERIDSKLYYVYKRTIGAGQKESLRIVLSAGNREDSSYYDVVALLNSFDTCYIDSQNYIKRLTGLVEIEDEKWESLFVSCMNASLSAYKEVEETGFKGFFAGINYQKPGRTYYRDGYWTIQSVLPFYPELVKNQIITLARGVNKEGGCASAVISSKEIKEFWGDHYDSPAFMILMTYDYISYSGDTNILNETMRDCTLLEVLQRCIGKLKSYCDEKGLIYKPPYCRRDWVDNVYREGYVTYLETLYCRALKCMSELFKDLDSEKSRSYLDNHNKVKKLINNILWNEEKGYYYNYVSENYKEDNLSIDSILTVLYDIVDGKRKERILENCEKYLETKNNTEQAFGSWGTMSVFPFYKYKEHLVEKSNYEYRYHNGSDWPYFDGVYALTKMLNGKNAEYTLMKWFDYSMEKGWFTPVEYYDPIYGKGSNLQAWSSMPAAAMVMGGKVKKC